MSLLVSLKYRPFLLLWSGQTVSRLGDSLFTIALAWWVLEKTGSATAMGIVLICSTVPLLLLLLLGGVAVDRLPKVRLMLASDIVRGCVVSLIALLVYLQLIEFWQLCVMSALFGGVRAFFYPAYTALIPDMVATEMLPSANSLRSISLQVGQIIGPAMAAGIIALGGTSLAFALDGVSFAISAACVAALPSMPSMPVLPHSAVKRASTLQDIRLGIGTVLHAPWLWITLAIASLSTIFLDGPPEVALPLLVKQHYGAQVNLYALLTTIAALGSISAAFWLGRFKRLRWRGWLTYGAWLTASLMVMAVGFPLALIWVLLAFFILGAGVAGVGLAWANILQEYVPTDLLGRVASIDLLASSGFVPIGYGVVGIAADRLGAAPVFILGGAISAILIALGLLHPAIRAVD